MRFREFTWFVPRLVLAPAFVIGCGLFAGPAAAAVNFSSPESSLLFGAGVGGRLVAGDLDEDCFLDVVATRDLSTATNDLSLSLLYGDALGAFPDGLSADGGEMVSDVRVGDLDGDGHADLVAAEDFAAQGVPIGVCQRTVPSVVVRLADGLGGFGAPNCLPAKDHPSAMAIADFNGDRYPDLVVANAPTAASGTPSADLLFFRGRGDGGFFTGRVVLQQRADDLATADFDRDGRLDLVVAGRTTTYVLFGSGDGRFVRQAASLGGASRRVAVGDINGDGAPDIAAVGSIASQTSDDVVWVALNDGTGAFLAPASYSTGLHPVAVGVADFDLDGLADVVTAHNLGHDVWVRQASAGGTLLAPQVFSAGLNPMALVIEDKNLDGWLDIVVSNRNLDPDGNPADGTVSVLLQQFSAPLSVRTTSLPCATTGAPYRACLRARGGTPPYSWAIFAGALPDGLTLDPTLGKVSGTPTGTGVSDITVEVEDAAPATATRPLQIKGQVDLDLDGFTSCAGDCDDLDAARFPGAREICDARDNDCDGTVDAGADQDSDGVDDLCDNCPALSNADQKDYDRDGAGNVCDSNPVLTVSKTPGQGDYSTVQAAIEAATQSGTRITVLPGATPYMESVVVDRQMVFAIEAGAGGQAAIAGGAGPAVTVVSTVLGRPILLRGLDLSGAAGIVAWSPTRVDDCLFQSISGWGMELNTGAHEVTRVSMDASVNAGIRLAAGATLDLEQARFTGQAAGAMDIAGAASARTVLVAQGGSFGVRVQPSGALTLRHSTIADNAGAGVDDGSGAAVVRASIVYGNNSGLGDAVGVACARMFWSDVGVPDCTGTQSDVSVDPLFTADYHLAPASPCLDYGPNPAAFTGSPCLDLDGRPRLLDHDGDGLAQWDAGAFEAANPAPAPPDVQGLGWSDASTLIWTGEPTAAAYHIYRGSISSLSFSHFADCRDDLDPDRADTKLVDGESPLSGQGFYYSITAENLAGEESSLGSGSCAERSNFAPCP